MTEGAFFQQGDIVKRAFGEHASFGFRTTVDDYGAGFSGLRRLADCKPDCIKLDRHLVANINVHPVRKVIVRGICSICLQLSITVIAAGVESAGEYRRPREAGIGLFQGAYFGQPAYEALPEVGAELF